VPSRTLKAVGGPAGTGKAAGTVRLPEPPITLSEQGGLRYLHFGSEWVQGAMKISRPWDIPIEYVQQMMAWLLFLEPPERILQLGLGAGSLTRWCWRNLPNTAVEVVEAAGNVIRVVRDQFCLPPDDERLQVHHAEAGAFLAAATVGSSPDAPRRVWGVIQADLYDRHARGPVCDSLDFYRNCRAALDPTAGILVVNLFGEHASYRRNLKRIEEVFEARVLTLPAGPAGNVVVLAFSGPPLAVPASQLLERASVVERSYRLPARRWARALLDEASLRPVRGGGENDSQVRI
jgi:spermidine synthase